MKFILTEGELYVLNKYMKSLTIMNNLQPLRLTESGCEDLIGPLLDKALLKKKGDDYALADELRPFSKALDFPDFIVLNVFDVEGENAVEGKDFCAIKRKTVGVLSKDDDMYTLEFYEKSSLNTVLSEFLGLDIDEFSDNDPLPPFVITLSMKNFDDFIKAYNDNQTGAINCYQKVFGLPVEHLGVLASTIVGNNCRSKFIVQTKQNSILYTIYKKNGVTVVGYVKKKLFGEDAILSHQRLDEFVKWIKP